MSESKKQQKESPPAPPDEINPYIPMFISKAPWYIAGDKESLDHQRAQNKSSSERTDLNQWYSRGTRAGPAATKYRKGACENCGAISHKAKDCLERPRKVGAKWSGKDIKPDEVVQDLSLTYEAKRDRWNGYNPAEHDRLVEEYEHLSEIQKRQEEQEIEQEIRKKRKLKQEGSGDNLNGSILDELSESDDEYEIKEEVDENAEFLKDRVDTTTRSTIRNLRMREDIAKYLINLSDDHYNPKSRAMLADVVGKNNEISYTSDLSHKFTGEAPKMINAQVFAWDAHKRGIDVNLQANPTMAEMLLRESQNNQKILKQEVEKSILDKYGGEEYFYTSSEELRPRETAAYLEYSAGDLQTQVTEVNENQPSTEHSQVWGSYFDTVAMKWGYKCCKSLDKPSICAALTK